MSMDRLASRINAVSYDNDHREHQEGNPGFPDLDSVIHKHKAEPDVGKHRSRCGDSEDTKVLNFFGFIDRDDADSADTKEIKCCAADDARRSKACLGLNTEAGLGPSCI